MQLLTIAIPALERMQRDEEGGGREKIARITRYVTVGLAAVQAIGLVAGLGYIKCGWYQLCAGGHQHGRRLRPGHVDRRAHQREGRGERHQHADHGRYPVQPVQRHRLRLHQRQRWTARAAAWMNLLVVAVMFVIMVVVVTFVDMGERRIPLQIAKQVKGRRVYGGQSTHMSLKVCCVGVLPADLRLLLPGVPGHDHSSWSAAPIPAPTSGGTPT